MLKCCSGTKIGNGYHEKYILHISRSEGKFNLVQEAVIRVTGHNKIDGSFRVTGIVHEYPVRYWIPGKTMFIRSLCINGYVIHR